MPDFRTVLHDKPLPDDPQRHGTVTLSESRVLPAPKWTPLEQIAEKAAELVVRGLLAQWLANGRWRSAVSYPIPDLRQEPESRVIALIRLANIALMRRPDGAPPGNLLVLVPGSALVDVGPRQAAHASPPMPRGHGVYTMGAGRSLGPFYGGGYDYMNQTAIFVEADVLTVVIVDMDALAYTSWVTPETRQLDVKVSIDPRGVCWPNSQAIEIETPFNLTDAPAEAVSFSARLAARRKGGLNV